VGELMNILNIIKLAGEAERIEQLFKEMPICGDAKKGETLSDKVALILFQNNMNFEQYDKDRNLIDEITRLTKENDSLKNCKKDREYQAQQIFDLERKFSSTFKFYITTGRSRDKRIPITFDSDGTIGVNYQEYEDEYED
jgi:hypothetical protein